MADTKVSIYPRERLTLWNQLEKATTCPLQAGLDSQKTTTPSLPLAFPHKR